MAFLPILKIKDSKLTVAIFKVESAEEIARRNASTPFCKYVNLVLNDTMKPGYDDLERKATVLLENPVGQKVITLQELKNEVLIFLVNLICISCCLLILILHYKLSLL